jgi:hypothetical protein
MKRHMLLPVLFALLAIEVVASNVPDALWKKYPIGISVAVILFRDNKETKSGHLRIWIRNDSADNMAYSDHEKDSGVRISYLTSANVRTYLKDYPDPAKEEIDRLLKNQILNPSDVIHLDAPLNEKEMSIVESHAIFCDLSVFNENDKSIIKIDSGPWILSEDKQ